MQTIFPETGLRVGLFCAGSGKIICEEKSMGKSVELNKAAPDFTLHDFRGNQVTLSDFRGKKHRFRPKIVL